MHMCTPPIFCFSVYNSLATFPCVIDFYWGNHVCLFVSLCTPVWPDAGCNSRKDTWVITTFLSVHNRSMSRCSFYEGVSSTFKSFSLVQWRHPICFAWAETENGSNLFLPVPRSQLLANTLMLLHNTVLEINAKSDRKTYQSCSTIQVVF